MLVVEEGLWYLLSYRYLLVYLICYHVGLIVIDELYV